MADKRKKRITAEEFLSSYRDALKVYEYLQEEEAVLRARAENIKSSANIPAGWTGHYVTGSIQGKTQDGKNQNLAVVSEKEMIPLSGKTSRYGTQENVMLALIDHEKKTEEAKKNVIRIRDTIDSVLSMALPINDALMLKRRYLLFQSVNEIAEAMYCSPSTVSRRLRMSIHYLDSSFFLTAMTENG